MDTNRYNPNRRQYALTLPQRAAIDLLLRGANDRQIAEQLGVGRVTVTRWRLYDPKFQVELNRLRTEAWPGATHGLRALLPAALDTLSEQLRISPMRGRLALDLVVRSGLLGKPYSGAIATSGIGPETMDGLLDQEVLRHRAAAGEPADDASPAPITDDDRDAAYDRLIARLNAPDLDSDSDLDPHLDTPTSPHWEHSRPLL